MSCLVIFKIIKDLNLKHLLLKRNRGTWEIWKSFPPFQLKFYLQAIYTHLFPSQVCSSFLIACVPPQHSPLSVFTVNCHNYLSLILLFYLNFFFFSFDHHRCSMSLHHFSGLPCLDIRLSDKRLQATLKKFHFGLNTVLKTLFQQEYFIQVGFCLFDRDIT